MANVNQGTSVLPPTLSSVAYIVAVLQDIGNPKPVGYRIIAVSGLKGSIDVRDVPYDLVKDMLRRGARLENAELDKDLEVHITQGSYKAYPRIDSSTSALRGRNGLTVIYGVENDAGDVVGYGVVDGCGTVGNISAKRLLQLSNQYMPTNWEVYTKDAGDKRIRLKSGNLRRVALKKKAVVQSISSKMESEDITRAKIEANAEALKQIEDDQRQVQNNVDKAMSAEMVNSKKLAESEAFKRYDAALKALDDFSTSLSQGTFRGDMDLERKRLNEELADALKEYQEKCQEARDSYITDYGAATSLPALTVTGIVDSSIHPNVSKSANTKMVQVANNLNLISPYYGSMYSAVPKMFSMTIPTMAVSEKEMFINPAFLMQLPISEATFIYIHEMLHIALQHTARHGKRNNELWNIACDIYINELICRDFGIQYGEPNEKKFEVTGSNGKKYVGVLKCPDKGCFLSTVGETLDFSRDTAESIYRRLYEENKDSMQQQSSSGQGQSSQQGGQSQQQNGQSGQNGQTGQGQQSSQSGQGGQSGQGQQSTQDMGSNAQGSMSQSGQQSNGNDSSSGQGSQSGQGQGSFNGQSGQQSGQSGQGQDSTGSPQGQNNSGMNNTDGMQSGNDSGWSSAGTEAKGDSTLQDDIANSNIDDYRNKTISREIIYKGKKLSVTTTMDVMSDKKIAESENPAEGSWDGSRDAITRIITKRKLDEQSGKGFSLTSGEELVERSIDFALSSQRDWRVILRHMANKKPKKTYNINNPDRKLMNMGVTVASRQPIGKKTTISGIKFCVDVSGSIGEKELHRVFTTIAQILNEYKVDAEMIYWDTQITNVGSFEDLKGMLAVKPLGCGGTDVRCVFDYLTKKTKFKGMTEETPVKDISCVIIFTDGCFAHNFDEYARFFAKKVVWVIDDEAPPTKPPFGIVAKEKLS